MIRQRQYQAVAPRWFTVIATREVCSETMQFQSHTDVTVFANDKNHAMRLVRPEFRGFHLEVLP